MYGSVAAVYRPGFDSESLGSAVCKRWQLSTVGDETVGSSNCSSKCRTWDLGIFWTVRTWNRNHHHLSDKNGWLRLSIHSPLFLHKFLRLSAIAERSMPPREIITPIPQPLPYLVPWPWLGPIEEAWENFGSEFQVGQPILLDLELSNQKLWGYHGHP